MDSPLVQNSPFFQITMQNPNCDSATWDLTPLNVQTKMCGYITHTYGNPTTLKFIVDGDTNNEVPVPFKHPQAVVVFTQSGSINKIQADFSGVPSSTIINLGDIYAGSDAG